MRKNSNSVHDAVTACIATSCYPLIVELASKDPAAAPKASPEAASSPTSAAKKGHQRKSHRIKKGGHLSGSETVSGRFVSQLAQLMATLDATAPRFVRCIKSNALKCAGAWDAPLVLRQLLYGGVMEGVRIRRQGYPVRLSFQDFASANRVRCVCRCHVMSPTASRPADWW